MDSHPIRRAGRPRKGSSPLRPSEKMAALRARDKENGIVQINVKIPNNDDARAKIKALALKLRIEAELDINQSS